MGAVFPNSMCAPPAGDGGGAHVTILMRTRDRPVLLARALSSVLAQTHADWSLRLVNDGGEPAPVDAMVGEYAASFAGRIAVRHHPSSLGMEAAANAALDGSSGDFVAIHDDDDSWHPEFLAATTAFLRDPAHARFASVVTRTLFVFERIEDDTIVVESRRPDPRLSEPVDYATMLAANQFPPISQLIRRLVLDALGPFNQDLPVLGDWDCNLRILRIGDIGLIGRRLSCYHHRLAPGAPADASSYGNSVVAGMAGHDATRTLYGNAMLRQLAEGSPGTLGLVHVLLRESGGNHEALLQSVADVRRDLLQRSYDTDKWNGWRHTDLRDRLERIEGEIAELRRSAAAIQEVAAMVGAVLRPLRRLAAPLRRRR